MKNQYKYMDYAPLFAFRQKFLGEFFRLLYGNPGAHLRIIAVVGTAAKTDTLQLLTRLCQRWHRSIAILSSDEAIIIVKGAVVYQKPLKHFDDISGKLLQSFLRRAKKHMIRDVFIEVHTTQLLHQSFAGVDFDGGLVTIGSLQTTPSPEEEEWYTIVKEYFFDQLPYFVRKEHTEKSLYLNRDDFFFPELEGTVVDKIQTYGFSQKATLAVTKWKREEHKAVGTLRVPNNVFALQSNRSDVFSLYTICAVLLYFLGEGQLDERITADIAFPTPISPLDGLLHVQNKRPAETGTLLSEYFSPGKKKQFLVVLTDTLTTADVFALQGFLNGGGKVLLWYRRQQLPKSVGHILTTLLKEHAGLTVFSRSAELTLQVKLLRQQEEGVVLVANSRVLDIFTKEAKAKSW